MRFKAFWGVLLFCGLWPVQAAADNRFIVRHPSGLAALQQVCATEGCTVVRALDGNLNQLFLLTTSDDIDPSVFLSVLRNIPGVEDAEPDQVVSLVGGLDQVTTPPPGLSDTSPVTYFGASVWNGYANQPSAQIVRVSEAQTTFNVTGTGI